MSSIKRGKLGRGLAVSLAGLRATGALAVDGAWQKLRGSDDPALNSEFARREAHRFVAELGRLKGTYVKIGQMFALLGEHFLPPVLTEALHQLESQTPPLPFSELRSQLNSRHLRELDIDPQPLAAASLAQVHRATVRASGESICLKIQYPGLADVIDDDFDTVVRMLLLARWVQAGRDLDDWLESMREQLHHEIDYRREAAMGQRVARLLEDGTPDAGRFHVPRLHTRFCNDTVLAMEFVSGHVVTQPEVAALSQARRNTLGRAMLELFFCELYHWGLLQTDPNFGNYLVRSQGRKDQLVMLDFGSVLEPDENFLRSLGAVIAAGQADDRDGVVAGLQALGCLQADASEQAQQLFADFCQRLLEPLSPPERLPAEHLNDRGEYCWGRSQLMRRAGKQAAQSAATRHFSPPSREFAMIARKLTGVFTFIAVLNAEFNAHDMVRKHIAGWVARESA
jgi:predicted unusual protein kinase regulating ubiquinone biosynthesis (AarF/ABC1/UbiB family)